MIYSRGSTQVICSSLSRKIDEQIVIAHLQQNAWNLLFDPSHKSLSPLDKYTHMCTFLLQNGIPWDMWLVHRGIFATHFSDIIMGAMACQITSLTIVYSAVYSVADQRKHQSSASLAFVRRINRSPVNSPHKWPVTRKMFPFDDVIMIWRLNHLFPHGTFDGVIMGPLVTSLPFILTY